MRHIIAAIAIWMSSTLVAAAFTLLQGDGAERVALLPPSDAAPATRGGSSLFIGQEGASFFAPFPERVQPQRGALMIGRTGSQVARLRTLIALAEAGPMGYDAVQYGARIKTPKRPTAMTVGEIYAWIDATPGQPHAIGRYQFIPATLRSLVKRLGVDRSARFTPDLQDQLADVLLVEAGLLELTKGTMPRRTFMRNIAKIWAGLPLPSGKSYYEGYAGNKASMSWAFFDREMARIFPG